MKSFLSSRQRRELREQHRFENERRYADRIKALLLWDNGWTLQAISEALLLDEKTIRRYRKFYEEQGLDRLLNDDWRGSERKLTSIQEQKLQNHLSKKVYVTTKEIFEYVKHTYHVEYSYRGMQYVLKRLGFVYKKTKVVPGKADAKKQRAFVKAYKELKERKDKKDPIYFVDGVHPQHNSKPAYGWILKGEEKQIPSNTGRKRLNINGALNTETQEVITCEDVSVNAQSTIKLFSKLENSNPKAKKIYVILDNARYYRSTLVREYVEGSKIVLLFLPPYAPNLNLIERLWKFFKKKVLANRYYESYLNFKKACKYFFRNISKFKDELDTLLTDNFEIIEPSF